MWCYSKMLAINWVEWVLKIIRGRRSLYRATGRRQDRLMGQCLKYPVLLIFVMENELRDKNCRGQQRLEYLTDF